MSELVLALDISTVFGWAHDAPDGHTPVCGTLRLPPSEDGSNGTRFVAFRRWMHRTITELKPCMVVYEAPMHIAGAHRSTKPTSMTVVRLLIGLPAIAEEVSHDLGVRTFEVNIMTAKKYLAGSGRADKDAMMHRCRIFGWPVATDHEADACAIWAYSKCMRDPKWGPKTTPLFGRAR